MRHALFRQSFLYHAELTELSSDVSVTVGNEQLVFRRNDYYNPTVAFQFDRAFVPSQNLLGCILGEHDKELPAWFNREDCLFREVMYLIPRDLENMIRLLRDKVDGWESLLDRIFKVETSVNGVNMKTKDPILDSSGRWVALELQFPEGLGGMIANHRVRVSGLISKIIGKYPVHLVEPTLNPHITFSYEARGIREVSYEPFLNSEKPFEPDVQRGRHYITVAARSNVGEDIWVFPNSGVVFTWQSH